MLYSSWFFFLRLRLPRPDKSTRSYVHVYIVTCAVRSDRETPRPVAIHFTSHFPKSIHIYIYIYASDDRRTIAVNLNWPITCDYFLFCPPQCVYLPLSSHTSARRPNYIVVRYRPSFSFFSSRLRGVRDDVSAVCGRNNIFRFPSETTTLYNFSLFSKYVYVTRFVTR